MISRLIEKYAPQNETIDAVTPEQPQPNQSPEPDAPQADLAYDDWDYEQKYKDFVPTHEGPTMEAANDAEQGFSIWEVQSVSSPTATDQPSENAIVDKLKEGIELGHVHPGDIANFGLDGGLSQHVLHPTSVADLSSALSERQALEDSLHAEISKSTNLSPEEVDRAVEGIIENSVEHVEMAVAQQIFSQIEGSLADSERTCRKAAANPREFAKVLMENSESKADIHKALVALGTEDDVAAEIAEKLTTIASDPQKKAAFLNGTEGEAEYFTSGDSWKDADVDITNALEGVADEVAELSDRAGNDILTNSRIFTSGIWENPRSETFDSLKLDMTPEQAASFDKLMHEVRENGLNEDTNEERAKTVVDLAMMAVTGPLGAAAGLGMNLTGSAVSLNGAHADYEAARVATNHGLAAQGEERKAAGKLAFQAVFAAAQAVPLASEARTTPVNEVPLRLGGQPEPSIDPMDVNPRREKLEAILDFGVEKSANPIADKALGYDN